MAWYHIDGNDVVLSLRGLKDEGRGAILIFVRSITDGYCSTITKGLSNGKVTASKIKTLNGPVASCWESVDDLRERGGRRDRRRARRVMSEAGKDVFVMVKGEHCGS